MNLGPVLDLALGPGLVPLLLAALAVAAGACLQSSLGFGLGLLAAPLLALLDARLVPAPLLLVATVLTCFLTVRDRRALRLGELGWALAGRVPGTVIGALVVSLLPVRGLEAFFGVTVLAAVLLSVWGWAPPVTRGSLFGAGTVAGVMGTSVSTAAAPLAWLLQHRSGASLRANLSTFFFAGSALSFAGLVVAGHVGVPQLVAGATLLPAAGVGLVVSYWTTPRLDPVRTRWFVLGLSGLASVALIVRAAIG